MKFSRLLPLLFSVEFLGVVLFVFATGFPPFDDATEVDLSVHMAQHFLIVFAGILIAYPRYGRRLANGGPRGKLPPALALLASALVIVYWHLPGPWDSAVLDPAVHFVEHFSFLFVGLMCGSWILLLSDSAKIGALQAVFFGHMGYALALISPWNAQVYPLYPLSDQVILGWALLLTGPLVYIGIGYLIARNPDWLAGLTGKTGTGAKRETFLNRVRVPRWVAPSLSVAFVAALVIYFAATAFALGTAQPPPGGTVVYINESPVSWQYSPQAIRVVMGVNATVSWVSRSISYDTVTSRDGAFGSGAIPPGGTYTHTFTSPGTYQYYCLYHPWMTGTVTVLPSG